MITEFQVKVRKALEAGKQYELANEFEVAASTVWRWSEGVAKPHPKIQALVVKFIEEEEKQ